ncbi:hypothetical protein BAZSYMA_ACONTIG24851_4 [Bathymodiolus azoricus thioautotrophic gill symbiont]|uniref:Uncharacterized protein n=1 Tax=Bathymodiolus azoricus thioautotrophic gill symbiont TaxID=235205 RepID=A0A1H6LFZ8_9GAMM|nr:hypothetical protein BAZSYMA_ACONTIG24851_4 [Bathymodiolus azoricus thioautotrophic gill symbiont]
MIDSMVALGMTNCKAMRVMTNSMARQATIIYLVKVVMIFSTVAMVMII